MKYLNFLAALLIICCAQQALAQYPSNLHNQDLRVWLKSNLYNSQFNDLGYNSARQQMYSSVDEVNGKIHCIYTDFEMDAEFTTFPNPINAEHLIPQSFYGSVSPMRSDIHNIRPCHGSANSARSNFGFDEIPDNQSNWYGINTNGAYISTGNEPSVSDDYSEGFGSEWEPQEDRKGDVARAVFYFYTMYPTQAGPISNLIDLNLAYQWHLDDPIDALEIQRNDRAESAQGNRNPYIDYVDLAYDAWFWVELLGCTNPVALNYDPAATTDDGSCIFGATGCTDPLYLEFDPEALSDDGSCMTLILLGCRYENALNYNPLANKDDNGSCLFDESECPGDFNQDNSITVGDLTGFLGAFGSACE